MRRDWSNRQYKRSSYLLFGCDSTSDGPDAWVKLKRCEELDRSVKWTEKSKRMITEPKRGKFSAYSSSEYPWCWRALDHTDPALCTPDLGSHLLVFLSTSTWPNLSLAPLLATSCMTRRQNWFPWGRGWYRKLYSNSLCILQKFYVTGLERKNNSKNS